LLPFIVDETRLQRTLERGLLEGVPSGEKTVLFDLNPEHFHGFYGHVLQSDVCVEVGG
jgi:hypothetical protein